MANISAFEIGERQASDVTAVQAPVQEQVVQSPLLGIADLAGKVAGAFGGMVSSNRQAEAAALDTDLKNQYIATLDAASGSVDQEGGSRGKALNFLSKKENELTVQGLSREEMTDLKLKYGKTFAGKKLNLGTIQEQAEQAMEEKGINDGWIKPYMTDSQVAVALQEMGTFEAKSKANEAAMSRLALKKATVGATKDETEAVNREIKQQAFTNTGDAVAGFRPQVKASVEDVLTRVGKGEFPAEDGIRALQSQLGDLSANIANIGRGGDLAQIKFMSAPLLELYTRAIADLKNEPASALSKLQNANALIEEKVKFNLLSNPDLAENAQLSTLFGHSPIVAALVSNGVAEHIKKNTADGPPSNLTGDKDAQVTSGNYLKGLTEGIGAEGQVGFDGSPTIDSKELFTNVEQTLNGANRYIRAEDPASESKALLEWMANPQVGEYLKTNMGRLDSAARTKLADTLLTSGEQQVFPEVRDELKFSMRSSFIGPDGARPVVPADINLTVVGNQVVFKATTAAGRIPALELNQKASKALTTYLRAVSNVSGTDLAAVLEENMFNIWPAKVVPDQGEDNSAGAVADEENIESIPNGQYTDSRTGEPFTINNGTRTEGWE
jgi:hypothetical protein